MKKGVTEIRRREYDELVCSKYGLVKRLLARHKLGIENEEDVTQEIMTVALTNIHKLRDLEKIDLWITRITHTCLCKFWRKQAKWEQLFSERNIDEIPLTDREMRDFCT